MNVSKDEFVRVLGHILDEKKAEKVRSDNSYKRPKIMKSKRTKEDIEFLSYTNDRLYKLHR